MEQNKEDGQNKINDPNAPEIERDSLIAGQLPAQQSQEDVEASEDDEKLNVFDRVRMGMSSIGLLNTFFLGSPGAFFIEKITNYANIDTTSSVESGISFVIGFAVMLVGNTVYDKAKRVYKD
jgi:hypothetical protein